MCNLVRKAVEECDENGPLVIFIAKMVAADKSDIAGVDELLDLAQETEAVARKDKTIFMGFGRIFSGTFNTAKNNSCVHIRATKYTMAL